MNTPIVAYQNTRSLCVAIPLASETTPMQSAHSNHLSDPRACAMTLNSDSKRRSQSEQKSRFCDSTTVAMVAD